MGRILLLPPGRAASPLAVPLERAGHDVIAPASTDREEVLAACDPVPDAIVVDLARAPSTGRDLALWLRARKAMRGVPIVLVAGDAKPTAGARALLPGALEAADASDVARAVESALATPPVRGRPAAALAGYSGTPLPKKLGIGAGATVVLLGAPDGFHETLGTLAEGARLAARGRGEVAMLFVRSRSDLERRLPAGERAMADGGRLWVAWPKLASGVATDLRESTVRELGLAAGLVDYKVAAIDATWAGLCFARRKPARSLP